MCIRNQRYVRLMIFDMLNFLTLQGQHVTLREYLKFQMLTR